MVMTIVAAGFVALALILASVLVARVHRLDDMELQDLAENMADLDTLIEIRRLQSRGW